MAAKSQNRRFLLVDDDQQIRKLVLRELRLAHADAVVDEVLDEDHLRAALESPAYDLVVTDYALGWTDGIKVLKEAKAAWPTCPVIMFTGTGNEEIAVEAMKLGLDDYIVKSARHMVRLRGAVDACLRNAEVLRREEMLSHQISTLLTQLEVGVFSCTLEGELTEANPSLLRLLDCDSVDQLQRSDFAGFIRDRLAESSATILNPENPRCIETDLHVKQGAGKGRVLQVCAGPSEASGRGRQVSGLVEDVTLRRQAEHNAREAAVAEARIATLSPRERQVFDHVIDGRASKVIARRLDISEKTVEKHRASLMKKVGVTSVAELVRLSVLAQRAS